MPRVVRYKYDYLAERCLEAWERDQPKYVAVDTETSGFNWEDRPFCVTVAWERPTTVVNRHHGEGFDEYIGRGTKWGNPYSHREIPGTIKVDSREDAVRGYRTHLRTSGLIEDVEELRGKRLACSCAPKACHGDILAELAGSAWEAHYLELEQFSRSVAGTIIAYSPELVFHNAKFDLRMLVQEGIVGRYELDHTTLHDTQTLAYLLNEHRRKALKFLARELLGEMTNEEEYLKEVRKRVKKTLGLKSIKDVSYDMLPRPSLIPYAIKDAEFTIRLFHMLYPEVVNMPRTGKDFPSLHELYVNEMELTLVLLDMETAGLGVDLEYTERTAKEYARKALMLELDIRDMVGREDFNPNSPKQLTEAFAERGTIIDSTNKQTLSELDDPLAEKVLELRSVKKMHGTYLTSMLDETVDGVLHPHFNAAKTKTARFSSSSAGE